MLSICAYAQPKIGSVVNAASYTQAPPDANNNPVGNNVVAQGSIITIFGTGLGPSSLTYAPALPLPTSLPDANGTSVSVSAGGQTLNAYMVYTSSTQLAAILPSATPAGAVTLTVKYNGQTSPGYQISVAPSSVGVFTTNSQGNGPGSIQIANAGYSANALTNSAQAGDTLVIYATGLGAISGSDNTDPGATAAGSNVVVNIAGKTLTPQYAGRAPGFPGLDQINVTLPANVATGCYVPAEITSGGIPSSQFQLSIGTGSRTCVHPLGLSNTTLSNLDAGKTANIGLFLALRAVVLGTNAEGAGGVFDKVNRDGAWQLTNQILDSFGGAPFNVASGSCAVLDTINPATGFSVPNFQNIGGTELDAGAGLSLSGPNGAGQGILHQSTGGYLGVFFATLGPGNWTISGSGGNDVNAFSAQTSLPTNLTWTNNGNFNTVPVPRSDVTVLWTGGNLNSQSLVTIFGSSVVINSTDPTKSRGKQFFCNAPAGDGKFVIPASVMSQLPSSTTATNEVAYGNLGISSGAGSSFSAPLKAGTLDAGYFVYGEAQTLNVKYQ
ncbi:MAG: hypothetical protein JO022_00220 [Acidobacteriaceae bacterium]|nr:hypothetical protein [Acidobacteriaceae bacterium]